MALISPAWDLLVAASFAEPGEDDLGRMRALLRGKVDWDRFIRLAEDHGTASLVCQNLARVREAVPTVVLESLRQLYERNVHKSLFLARELIRVLDCIEGLGIEVVPYKGAVLSEVYYGDVAMRQSGDMDLFVRGQDVAKIKNAVRDLGYTPRMPVPEAAEKNYIASGYECTFDSPLGKNLLELQWALEPRFYAVDFDMNGLFERSVEVSVAGRRMRTPSAEDLLLVLAVHAAKHVWGRLIWLCDIAQILRRENLDWDWVDGRARQFGIERILHITLLLANRFWGTEIPAGVVDDECARRLADEIAASVAAGVPADVQQVSYFQLMMRIRERRIDRWRFISRLAFTPGPGEWDAVRLPRVLFPLYRVVRMARLAGRFGARVVGG